MSESEVEQIEMFPPDPAWRREWKGMPEFSQEDQESRDQLIIHFHSRQDRKEFLALIGQPHVSRKAKWAWYPVMPKEDFKSKKYSTEAQVLPRYPLYVISKGRWDTRLTVKALERAGIPFRVVIEPQELAQYAAVIPREQLLVLPRVRRLGKVTAVLLDGHPTKAQLAAGRGKRGGPVSEWNVWCDRECARLAQEFQAKEGAAR